MDELLYAYTATEQLSKWMVGVGGQVSHVFFFYRKQGARMAPGVMD